MTESRPQPRGIGDMILAEIADLMIANNELLGQVLARLPEQSGEPAKPDVDTTGADEPVEVEITEPKPPRPKRATPRRSGSK